MDACINFTDFLRDLFGWDYINFCIAYVAVERCCRLHTVCQVASGSGRRHLKLCHQHFLLPFDTDFFEETITPRSVLVYFRIEVGAENSLAIRQHFYEFLGEDPVGGQVVPLPVLFIRQIVGRAITDGVIAPVVQDEADLVCGDWDDGLFRLQAHAEYFVYPL